METAATAARQSEPSVVRVGVICGGPSEERGISLNSGRSILDHLQGPGVEIDTYFVDRSLQVYAISHAQMYSNTPSDFDFKLSSTANKFESHAAFLAHLKDSVDIVFPALHGKFGEDGGIQELLESAGIPFVGTSAAKAALAFDKHSAAIELAKLGFATLPSFLFQGNEADEDELATWFAEQDLSTKHGRVVVKPARAGSSMGVSVAIGIQETIASAKSLIEQGIDHRVVVEAFAEGGKEFTAIVLDAGLGDRCQPVTLLPTEVELKGAEEEGTTAIFDYRRKYLPTQQVSYYTPPRFPLEALAGIREGAAKLFAAFSLRDFARIDGWLLPAKGNDTEYVGSSQAGTIVFSDINIISGMEQTSFLFQQAAQVGFSHADILRFILARACSRIGVQVPSCAQARISSGHSVPSTSKIPIKQPVYVLFGGDTSERQVSLMSGTNVWLKLRTWDDAIINSLTSVPKDSNNSSSLLLLLPLAIYAMTRCHGLWQLEVSPFLLPPSYLTSSEDIIDDCHHSLASPLERIVWALPINSSAKPCSYAALCPSLDTGSPFAAFLPRIKSTVYLPDRYYSVLRHTVEEVVDACEMSTEPSTAAIMSQVREEVVRSLTEASQSSTGAQQQLGTLEKQMPQRLRLANILELAQKNGAVIYMAVHGGIGEDGTLQRLFESSRVAYTGSSSKASRLCMDKADTANALKGLEGNGVHTANKVVETVAALLALQGGAKAKTADSTDDRTWRSLTSRLGAESLCVKPVSDGCSTGVARLSCPQDLSTYVATLCNEAPRLLPGSLTNLHGIIEMPVPAPSSLLFEPFIETDPIRFNSEGKLVWEGKSRWVEITQAVLGKQGQMVALNPSITVKESGDVLSLEEKFQGGTGVNLTPPPASIVSEEVVAMAKRRMQLVANTLGLDGFARVDAFLHVDTGEILVIEANTVPGMTPSTVLYQQCLAEKPLIYPRDFCRRVVDHALARSRCP
eukprot:SM000345S12845  [mRNA]  locus=s345:21219:28308:- [translate_table: standard]